jgi:dTDP-4-dehydrorhamnose reductase
MAKKILVLGVTGMLGSAVFTRLSDNSQLQVFGTLRTSRDRHYFAEKWQANLVTNVDVLDQDTLISVFSNIQPDVVINCVGLIKQLSSAKDPLSALPINSLLPHRLAKICSLSNARLIHISTDCVFSGKKGMYLEEDSSDAEDLYGS